MRTVPRSGFNSPNRIGPGDWSGWVQERGTYFLAERDPRYVDLIRRFVRSELPESAVLEVDAYRYFEFDTVSDAEGPVTG